MDFSLSDEQRLPIDTVRRFIREELAPLEDEARTQRHARASLVAMVTDADDPARAGWLLRTRLAP